MEISLLEPEDTGGLAEVLALMQLIQPHLVRDIALLDWQYRRTPAGPGEIYVARDAGVIRAVYCAVAQRVQLDGAVFTGRMIQDVMTHPDYRGQGLLHQLAAVCLEDLKTHDKVGYTFPNERSERSFRRTGWEELGRVPARAKSLEGVALAETHDIVAEEVETFDDRADAIWYDSGLRHGVVRDRDFLNWRYHKPGQRYVRFLLDGDQGVLVLKLFDNGAFRTVHVCDLFARRASASRLVPAALRCAEQFGRSQGATTVTAWVAANHLYAGAFDASQMMTAASGRFIFVACPGGRTCADESAWHISQGDSDVY